MRQIYIVILLLTASVSFSQRHLKNEKGLGIDGGITDLGWYVAPTFSYQVSNRIYLKSELMYESAEMDVNSVSTKFNSFYLNVGAYYNLFHFKEFFFFNLGAGLQGTYADTKNIRASTGGENSPVNEIELDGGLYGGVEGEFYLTDRCVFLLNFKQAYQPTGNFGNWIPFTGGGFKYNF